MELEAQREEHACGGISHFRTKPDFCMVDKRGCPLYNKTQKTEYLLIKSGGGTGPVMPGNLHKRNSENSFGKVLIPAESVWTIPKDEANTGPRFSSGPFFS